MRLRILAAASMATALLSGCTGSGDTTGTKLVAGPAELAAGKGGILGLLIDDIYRPIPGALLLVEGQGLTATTDERGQFSFVDLEPGTYVLLPSAERHEAAPANVDVSAGQNDKRMETPLFPQGRFKAETQAVLDAGCGVAPTCFESRGLGVQAGVKANFVQTLFLGEPAIPIDEYHVYSPG